MRETSERIFALDVGRGFAVFCMIIVHALWVFGKVEVQEQTWFGDLMHFLGKGTAAFLVVMGFCFIISRNQTIYSSVKRGILILLLGYFMNFLKFIPPLKLFQSVPANFLATYGWQAPLDSEQLVYLVKTGDILQMVGMSLMVLGVIRHYLRDKYYILALAVLIAFSTRFLNDFQLGIRGVDYFLDLFFSTQYSVFFPVVPWISSVLFGMFMGMWFVEKGRDHSFIFHKMLSVGILMLVIGGALCLYDHDYHFGDFFHQGPGGIIYLTSFNFIVLSIVDFLDRSIGSNFIFRFFAYLSRNVTSLYVIQAILIGWAMGLVGFQQLNGFQLMAAIPVAFLIVLAVQAVFRKIVTFLSSEAVHGSP